MWFDQYQEKNNSYSGVSSESVLLQLPHISLIIRINNYQYCAVSTLAQAPDDTVEEKIYQLTSASGRGAKTRSAATGEL
ncbi:hypothetical protein LUU34_00598500 [Aix galericulata]|nr:hypothetical protein LUU34_00598500 [Aix galericulata]